jgi:hypothetical protein
MPKKKTTSSVNVDAVKREVKKFVKDAQTNSPAPGPLSKTHAEVAPGTIQKQSPLEQDMGSAKYRQMIHDHNSKNKHILDRLPFTFPKKKVVRSHLDVVIQCAECGLEKIGSENTVGFVCTNCKKYVSAINPEAESRGFNPDLRVGFRGTASDRLNKKEKLGTKKGQ